MASCSSCGRSGKRDCPVLKGFICTECCGSKRGSELQCPAECIYFPFSIHTYDQWLKLDSIWLPKALDFILSQIDKEHFNDNMELNHHGDETSSEAQDARFGDTVNYSLCVERDDKGQTLADIWEKEGFKGLTNDERVMTQYRHHTFATILEVQKIVDHQSILCVDVLEPDSKPFIVFDRGMAKSALPFGWYISWVTHYPHYSRVTGSGLEVTDMIRSAYEKSLINNAANEAHRRRGFTPKMFLSENFGECCDAITNMARDTLENMARNLDAHQIVSSYRIQGERSEIEAILKSKPEFRLDDALRKEDDHPTTVRYVWQRVGESKKIEKEMPDMFRHEEGDMAVGILGTVKLFSDQFVLETISKQKHKFAKKMVKKYWGKRLVLEKEATVDLAKHAIKSAREGWDKRVNGEEVERPPRQSSVPPEVEAEILRTTMTEHYQKFIDMTVPLLDGMTPREASKVPKMHPKLVELMKIHLHGLHKMRVEKSLEIDMDWLLDELGLEELK